MQSTLLTICGPVTLEVVLLEACSSLAVNFYYKLRCDLLPSYFNTYLDVINRAPPRQLRINLIHQPVIKRNYAKCGLLFDLLNSLQINPNDTILAKIYEKSHSYNGFAFNVTRIYLDTYDPVCRLRYCYVCERFQIYTYYLCILLPVKEHIT